MNDEEKRFTQQPEEIEIIFVPQCCNCKFNRDLKTCEKFILKPTKYRENEAGCPKREPIE